jgi:hypothetical protein
MYSIDYTHQFKKDFRRCIKPNNLQKPKNVSSFRIRNSLKTFEDMSKYEIPYLTASIQAFAQRFSMTRQAAFRYLHEHKGLAFLIEFFDVEHLQSMDETVDDLLIVCQKNGGTLS